ncbi:hypothetical protein GGR21_000371 [Dysgonomonas hofstadii]|uniref:Uncharacterized protein n=1 Tax=Dysgonomonas hofstadii TaxID=637886 RepID=A0A840CGX1_9BACT|nr:hypothetical protein [Dysgonomonas hofstadii]MBB4034486.1 hypothetical protein [Dysgonomonas hofstadii]
MKEIQDLNKMNMDDRLVFVDRVSSDKKISPKRKKMYTVLAFALLPLAIFLHSKEMDRRAKKPR